MFSVFCFFCFTSFVLRYSQKEPTFVDGDGIFEDMWEIPIDLSQLQEMHGQYTVLHVVAEIERQLSEEDAKLVVTDIKGNPIRDMPSTRGETLVSSYRFLEQALITLMQVDSNICRGTSLFFQVHVMKLT